MKAGRKSGRKHLTKADKTHSPVAVTACHSAQPAHTHKGDKKLTASINSGIRTSVSSCHKHIFGHTHARARSLLKLISGCPDAEDEAPCVYLGL